MDLNTVIGLGVAISVPVWLVAEEIAHRRRARRAAQAEGKTGVRSERPIVGGFRRPAPGLGRQVVSRLSA